MVAIPAHPRKRRGFMSGWMWPLRMAAVALVAFFVFHATAVAISNRHTPIRFWWQGQQRGLTAVGYGQRQHHQEQGAKPQNQPQQQANPETQDTGIDLREQQAERQRQMLQTQQKVYNCLSAGWQASIDEQPASYESHRTKGEVARLIPVRLWQSTKAQPQQSLTIVSALSKQRLPMFEAQCQSWPGPLAVVLYEPTVVPSNTSSPPAERQQPEASTSTLTDDAAGEDAEPSAAARSLLHTRSHRRLLGESQAQAAGAATSIGAGTAVHEMPLTQQASQFQRELLQGNAALPQQYDMADTEKIIQESFAKMEALGPKACSMSVLLVTELIDESLEEHLPVNSLRNQAVLLAQTPLIAMLDADMVVSRSLAESLQDPDDAEAFVNLVQGPDDDGTRLVVLPAFETLPFKSRGNELEDDMTHKVAEFATKASKDAIKGLMDVGLLGPFNKIVNAPGHAETDYQKWLDFRGDAAARRNTYSIQPQHEKFEPWYIMDRQAAIKYPYDEVFRGYGKNKIAHRIWLSNLGFKFLVHGSAFIVHRLHVESEAKLAWRSQLNKGGPHNTWRLEQLLPLMEKQKYQPSLAEATATCAQQARQRHELWHQQQQQQQQQQRQQQEAQPTDGGQEQPQH